MKSAKELCGTELGPDLPRRFSNDLQIPACRVEEKMRGNAAASTKTRAFLSTLATIPDVEKVGPRIRRAHDLYSPCLGQDWLAHVPKTIGRDDVDVNSE